MKTIIFALAASFSLSTVAYAQSENALCHHAGLTYSPGSVIRMGKSLQKCTATEQGTSIWAAETDEEANASSANCVSGGREFGQGSILNAGSFNLKCSRGIWYEG